VKSFLVCTARAGASRKLGALDFGLRHSPSRASISRGVSKGEVIWGTTRISFPFASKAATRLGSVLWRPRRSWSFVLCGRRS
jgi:hypothetical protein